MANQDVIYDFVTSVVLDVEVSNKVTSESLAIGEGLSDSQVFAIARAEAWRQMRARNVFAFDIPAIPLDADPVQALTLMERSVLSLSLRQKLEVEEISQIVDETRKIVNRDLKEGRKNLARAAIALALMNNQTKCPVIVAAHQTLGSRLTRAQQMHLVTHAAECSICVNVLRVVDKQVIQDFINAPVLKYPNNLSKISDSEKERLIKRAELKDGWPPSYGKYFENPRVSLKSATIFGAASSALIALGLYLLRQ
ncbi:MAG: hypothetical protein RJA41_547 [Actinomycetota bacterium]